MTRGPARPTAFDADRAARALHAELRSAGDPGRSVAEQRYLKSELQHWGVAVPQLRKDKTTAASFKWPDDE